MTIPVIYWSNHPETPSGFNGDYWDQTMIRDILDRSRYPFVYHDGFLAAAESPRNNTGAVVMVPARTHTSDEDVAELNAHMALLPWVIVILFGDEDGTYPTGKLEHPNMKVWLQLPHMDKPQANVDRFLPNGYAPDTRPMLKNALAGTVGKMFDWFFSGQVTHVRREECVKALRTLPLGLLNETAGFTQGLLHQEYFELMSNACTAPCPSGAVIPDSFRLYEALEAGCVPIADGLDPNGGSKGYWEFLFGEPVPFPTYKTAEELAAHIQCHAERYPRTNNKVFAWWQIQKRKMAYWLEDDINELTGEKPTMTTSPTVLIPTSVIPSHPDTAMIEETIASVRSQLPDAEIIVMIDGLRAEQKDRREDYEEYTRRLLWKCNHEWKNVLPLLFEAHTHQVGMAREALKHVKTSTILFVEADTPLFVDREYQWSDCIDLIDEGSLNVVRYHHEAEIHPEHRYLMLDQVPIDMVTRGGGHVPVVRTGQFSARPHLASTEFYRWMLETHFSKDARCFIEDFIYGPIVNACKDRGMVGWNDFRVAIYHPDGDIKRSKNLDGRKDQEKFSETQIR